MPLDFRDIGPPRTGNRGGLGLFNWADVAKDKDKSHYLGNSLKSATGMWAQRKGNLSWFAEGKAETDSRSVELDEIAEIKRLEAEAMAQALGARIPISNEQDQMQTNEMIKKDLEGSASYRGEKIVGLGVQGAAKRDIVQSTRRAFRNAEDSGVAGHIHEKSDLVGKGKLQDERGHDSRSQTRNRRLSRSRSRDRDRSHKERDRENRRSRSRHREEKRGRSPKERDRDNRRSRSRSREKRGRSPKERDRDNRRSRSNSRERGSYRYRGERRERK